MIGQLSKKDRVFLVKRITDLAKDSDEYAGRLLAHEAEAIRRKNADFVRLCRMTFSVSEEAVEEADEP